LAPTGFGYDAAGNQTSSTSPEGHTTQQTFDPLSRLTSRMEPVSASESITTSFGYDATGARTRLTDGRGHATWTTYNSLGLPEKVTEPATTAHPNLADRTWTQIYDQAGNQVATELPGGVRIDRTFDHLNRLTGEEGAGGGATTAQRTFGYDLAGRTTTAGDLSVAYNDRGLPTQISKGGTQQTAYGYDALGNPTQRVDAAGTAAFTWDNANRLKTATDPVTGRTLTYGYDAASRLKTITATSGQASTQSFDYDPMNRLTDHTLKNGSGTQLAKVSYIWDDDDNLTTKTTTGTAGSGTNTYGYDHAGRLTSWTAPGGTTIAYEWDAAGNRTKAGNATFTYDERNRLTSGDGTDHTYTPRGTLATQTKNGTTTQLTFDAFDRLLADGDSTYSYDALDRVTSRIRGTTNQTFTYSGLGNDLATISAGGTTQARYSRDAFGGLLGLQEGAGAAVATMSDLHGDLIATFTTTLTTSTAYDPFGTVTAQTGTATTLGYQGEYTDPDTGKVNMHARWYQPGTGTFTSRDTMTLDPNPSVQANRYTYANASPLTHTDPTGHASVTSRSNGQTCFSDGNCYSDNQILYSWGNSNVGDGLPNLIHDDFDYYYANVYLPSVQWAWGDDEESKRTGTMPNGMRAPKGFWEMSAKERSGFMELATFINFINPSITEEELLGLASPAGGSAKASGASANGPGPRSYYDAYKDLLEYRDEIEAAAKKFSVDKIYLTAALIYEWQDPEAKRYNSVWKKVLEVPGTFAVLGKDGSYGVAQLEPYKLKRAWDHWMKIQGKNTKISTMQAVGLLINPKYTIDMAAMYMRFLHDTIQVQTPNGKRGITWAETAVAYCGCSGVQEQKSDRSWTYTRFTDWLEDGGGGKGPATSNGDLAADRWYAIRGGWAYVAALEYHA
jgi:RHS repeat-associated protein